MAEGHVKQVLEKEITCPLCLDILIEPKKLPCDHVYCRGCLEKLLNRSLDASVSCPECRVVTQVPNRDVSNFPTAFRLNRLIEAFQRVEVREETDSISTANAEPKCKVHQTERIVLYCETCQTLLCRDCVLATKDHTDHRYGYITEIKERLQKELTNESTTVESQSQIVAKAIDEITEVENDFAVCERQCQQEIEQAFGALHRTLQESKEAMKEKAVQQLRSASAAFVERKKKLQSIKSEISTAVEQTRNSFKEGDIDFLTQHSSVQKRIKQLQEKLGKVPLSVPERPQFVTPRVMADEVLKEQLEKYNSLHTFDPKKWQVSGSFINAAKAGEQYILTIENDRGKRGKLWRSVSSQDKGVVMFEAELLRIQDNDVTLGEIQQHSQDRYSLNIKAEARGRHKLSIKVNGVHIANSPFAVFVHMPPKQLNKPIAEIAEMRWPVSLCYSEESILVSEKIRNQVLKLCTATHSVSHLLDINRVEELTIDPKSKAVFATTTAQHQVHKFTKSGDLEKTIGSFGSLPRQFNFPNGLRVSTQDELYVCDSLNNRLQVFDLDLNFKRCFGAAGTGKGQFSFPSDVNFDPSGKIYVAEYGNHRIQVFAPAEQFLFMIGGHRNQPFDRPLSLIICEELMYITECKGHHVSVMTTSGELVSRFGEGHLQNPEGIAIDDDGYVYVTSHHSKVLVFLTLIVLFCNIYATVICSYTMVIILKM